MGFLGFGKKNDEKNAKKGKGKNEVDERPQMDAYLEIPPLLGRIEKTFGDKVKQVGRQAGEQEVIRLRDPLQKARGAQQRGPFRNILPNLLRFSELLGKSQYFMADGTFMRSIRSDITSIEQSLKKGKYI